MEVARRIFLTGAAFVVAVMMAACGGAGNDGDGEAHGHGHGGEEGGEVALTQAQMDAVGIQLGGIERREMTGQLLVTGTVEVDPRGEAVAAPRLGGTVTRICVAAGDRVSAGQAVAYIDAPEIVELNRQWEENKTELEAARVELRRQEALAAQGAGVKKNLDAARSAESLAAVRVETAASRIRAYGAVPGKVGPVAITAQVGGTVTAVEALTGGYADAQTPVVRIVDSGALYVRLYVLEKDVARAAAGAGVEMRLTNDAAAAFGGVVEGTAGGFDSQSRTVPVRVRLVQPRPAALMPGMAVSAVIEGRGEEMDALPEEAVVRGGGRNYIFVLEEEHDGEYHFEKTEVTAGPTILGYTAVTPVQPLPAGARIVVKGAFYLNSMASDHGEHNH